MWLSFLSISISFLLLERLCDLRIGFPIQCHHQDSPNQGIAVLLPLFFFPPSPESDWREELETQKVKIMG